jgi:hypothetical protein
MKAKWRLSSRYCRTLVGLSLSLGSAVSCIDASHLQSIRVTVFEQGAG